MNSNTARADATPIERLAWALLMVLISQAYAIWLAFAGTLEYVDYQLLAIADTALLQLMLLFFDKSERPVQRIKSFAAMCLAVLPALFLFNALLVYVAMLPSRAYPSGPFTIVAETLQRATGKNLRPSLIFLALSFGPALAYAFDNRNRSHKWWSDNSVFVERGAIIFGTFLICLFLLAPVIMVRQQNKWAQNLSSHSMNLALIAMMLLLRIGIATLLRYGRLRTKPAVNGDGKPKRAGKNGS